ncbi:MAG TPA: ABC transporter permease [Bryobacteraceae bacterium]|jgi:predicted permease|nr:ABC transporter permease [Bryobacteraceae bacterium]
MNWRRFFRRRAADAEQREELEFYVDVTAEEYVARGMNLADAKAAARKKLGNATLIQEEIYQMNTLTSLEGVLRDLRHALRIIRTKPGFSIPALLSLGLGIGANIAIFSVVNAVLIRPLLYPAPEKLVGVFNSAAFSGLVIKDWPLSLRMYAAYKEDARSFEEFGVWTAGTATVSGLGEPEQIPAVSMTHGVLRALQVRPYLGRWFSNADEIQGAQKTVILSHKYWQQRFAGDPRVLGRLVLIDFVPRQVVGVMPRGFEFLNLTPDVFLPQSIGSGVPGPDDADHSGVARLKSGVSLAQANQDIARVLSIWGAREGMRTYLEQLRVKPNVHPLKQDVVGDVGAVLKIFMGALLLVLLLVCANIANLAQVRARARHHEFAIRAALGAGRGRIARELLAESLALGVLGGGVGLGLAYAGLRLLVTHGPAALPRVSEISIDSTSILFALACSLGSSALFGFIAILKSGLNSRLQNARGASASMEQLRTQNVLVVAQVALALMLLIAAGLLLRSFVALRAVRPGFTHPEQIQMVRLFIPEAQIQKPEQVAQMQADILHKLAAIPGVTAAAFTSALPLEPEHHNGNPVAVEGKTPPDGIPPNRTLKIISPGLFAALGAGLIAGRDFAWDDLLRERPVAIVSENMARENWGDPRNALGKRIRISGTAQWSVVVGVAENVYDDGVDRQPPGIVYFPGARRGIAFAIRSRRAGTEGFLREITASIHAVNSNLPLAQVRTLNDLYNLSMGRTSFALVLLGIAAAMAQTLAIVGVYGVLAYAAAQRCREVSIRVALGAEPGMVKALFVRQGLILACIGGAIGLASAGGLSRWTSSLLFGVTPVDPLTYGVAGGVILVAALTASYIPARRAASLNPMEALRSD